MYELVKHQLIIDLATYFIDSEIQIKTKDLIQEFPERDYFSLFNNHGKKGKALQQRFFHIERLRRKKLDKFKKELQYARKQMNIPTLSNIGFGSRKSEAAAASPVIKTASRSKKQKLDTPTVDAHMTSPKPAVAVADTKKVHNHWEYFAHLSLEELKEICK